MLLLDVPELLVRLRRRALASGPWRTQRGSRGFMRPVLMAATSYDKLWQTQWGDIQRFGPVHRHLLERLVHMVSALEVQSVLDIGCGSGENLRALATLGRYQLSGVDVSSEAIQLATGRVSSARLKILDIERESLPEQFDLVMSLQVVEHLVDDIAAFRHMAQMVRRYVFISTIQGLMRASELKIGHVRNYSPVELRCKLERAGLEVIWMEGWGFPFYSPIYRTLTEWLPNGPPSGPMGPLSRVAAVGLYHLYRLNWPGRGDVLSVLARPR